MKTITSRRWSYFPARVFFKHKTKITADCSVFKFLRCSANGKRLMRLQSENTVLKFLRFSVPQSRLQREATPDANVAKIDASCDCRPLRQKKIHIFTCSLDRTTFGVSPSRLAMFTFAPCVVNSFAIWSISRPLAVWSGVLPANVTLFTSAPRDIKYSAMWYFPASTAWCKGVRPLLESYIHGRYRWIIS